MIRIAVSAVLGFVLLYFQSYIVMKLNGYSGIVFDNMLHFTIVWTIDFFLAMAMLTQLMPVLIRFKVIDDPESAEEEELEKQQ